MRVCGTARGSTPSPREAGRDRPDRGGRAAHRGHGRPLRRGQPARLLQPDPRDRRGRRVPEDAVDELLSGAHLPAGPRARSPGPTRSRSSASATACPRATCRASAASRCSWPPSPTRSSRAGTLTDPAKLAGLDAGRAAVGGPRRGLGPARVRPAGVRTSPRGTSRSTPCRPQGIETNARGSVVRVDPASGARVRRAAHRRAGRGRAEGTRGRRDTRADDARAPAAAGRSRPATTSCTCATARARAGSPVRFSSGSPGSASSAARWTTPPTPRRRWSATATATTRPRRSPRSSAGSRWSRTTPSPSGHLQVMLGADAPTLMPGLPAPAPPPTTTTAATAEPPITAAGVPCVD